MKYLEVCFYTERPRLGDIKRMLVTELGLVSIMHAHNSPEELVLKDEAGVEQYRVDFMQHTKGYAIYFRYLTSHLTPRIREQDPMLEAVRRTYRILESADKRVRCDSCISGIIQKEITEEP